MRNVIKISLIFTLGLILGCIITTVIFAKINQQNFADDYSRDVLEQANLAKILHLNKQEELLKNIEAKLPVYVLAIHENPDFLHSSDSEFALQTVRDFYECSKKEIPQEIAKILAELPPSPANFCEIKK